MPEGAGSVFKQSEKNDENEVVQHSTLDDDTTFYYVSHSSGSTSEVEEYRALTRLPTFVIFHGIAHERGVPPSFTGSLTSLVSRPPRNKKKILLTTPGFVRQWPALPRFGIFLTVSVLPVAHVEDMDRYVVTRVDTISGFYGVAQYRGFRDEPSFHIDEIITKISELEVRLRPDRAGLIASQLREQSVRLTHVYVSGQS